MNQYSVCAVCVTWFPDFNFEQHFVTLRRQVEQAIIVDNSCNSEQNERLTLLAKEQNAIFIAMPHNSGVAGGYNIGSRKAQENGFNFVLWMDQDSVASTWLVDTLLQPWLAVSGPNLALTHAAYLSQGSLSKPVDLIWVEKDVVILSGSLVNLSNLASVGWLREEFFMDSVDTDLSRKLNQAGLLLIESSQPLMSHQVGVPCEHQILWKTKRLHHHPAWRRYYMMRNNLVLQREAGRKGLVWSTSVLVKLLKSSIYILLFDDNKIEKINAIFMGWFDGVQHQLGCSLPDRFGMSRV